jgi:hypothetical protein
LQLHPQELVSGAVSLLFQLSRLLLNSVHIARLCRVVRAATLCSFPVMLECGRDSFHEALRRIGLL